MTSRTEDLLIGAASGAVGTVAMTVLMKPGLVGMLSPKWRPEEFVPGRIVRWMEKRIGRPGLLTEDEKMVIASIAHLGYGSAMGAIYGALRGAGGRLSPAAAGALWGFAVWVAGYEGWLPAAGIRPATTDFPPSRWPVPIANHLLFGVVTAVVFERLRSPGPAEGLREGHRAEAPSTRRNSR